MDYEQIDDNPETPVAANPDRPLTFGEKAVGLTFNPSQDPDVYAIKSKYAEIIDALHQLRGRADESTPDGYEQQRLATIAITEAQGAQMWAVKAATWKI